MQPKACRGGFLRFYGVSSPAGGAGCLADLLFVCNASSPGLLRQLPLPSPSSPPPTTLSDPLQAGTIISPHVLTADTPPTNIVTATATLKFPGIFSGAKISSRKKRVMKDSFAVDAGPTRRAEGPEEGRKPEEAGAARRDMFGLVLV